jgi:hypothetical protein
VLTYVTNSGKTASSGGGMYNYSDSSPVLINVTISGNTASGTGGGMYNSSSSPKIRNSIIWGNTALNKPGINNDDSSTPVITYSIVQDSPGNGIGNVGDPGTGADYSPFVAGGWQDPASVTMPNSNGNYRLKTGSPAINAGSDGLYPSTATDAVFSGITLSNEAKAAINAALAKDLGGNGRKNGTIDMGAYEYQ